MKKGILDRRLILLAAVALVASATAANAGGIWEKSFKTHAHLTSILEFGSADCDPGDAKVIIEGGANASYLGAVNDFQSHCFNFATGFAYNGQYTLSAVDGTIYGTYEAQSVPTVNCPDLANGQCYVKLFGEWTIDGGTGRFEPVMAGGGGIARGLSNTATGETGLFLDGIIRSDGALKGEY